MANTFDTSRVGGGTYELEQDSNGNYKLKSVGFNQVNKLNLPDLATSDATKPPVATIPKQPKIDDPFKKLASQNTGGGEGGGQDYSAIAPREAKVKEATVSELGQKTNTTYNAMTDAEKNAIATGTSGMVFDGPGVAKRESIAEQNYNEALSAAQAAKGASPSIYSNALNNLTNARTQLDNVYSTSKTYSTPRTIADQNKYLGRTFTNKTTGLQKVTSAVSNTVENIMNNSATVAVAKGVGSVVKGIANAITSPEQQINNSANMTALNNAGLKTNFQLGRMTDPGRVAASPQDSVFGGMNAQSGFGDISAGAASRIDTRNTIGQARVDAKYGKDSKKSKDFADKTKGFEKELQSHNNTKNTEKEKAKTKETKATNPNKKAGAGDGGNGCFIKGTLITMFDGSKKPVEQVDLGDKVAEGGNVFAAGRFLNTELYDYKGIKVSGSHMVNEDGTWMRVKDTKHGKSLGDDLNTVYVFGSENRRILINGILFTDYFEINEQDKLIEDSEDFFNNWKNYGNDVDVDNVATLNMNYEI